MITDQKHHASPWIQGVVNPSYQSIHRDHDDHLIFQLILLSYHPLRLNQPRTFGISLNDQIPPHALFSPFIVHKRRKHVYCLLRHDCRTVVKIRTMILQHVYCRALLEAGTSLQIERNAYWAFLGAAPG